MSNLEAGEAAGPCLGAVEETGNNRGKSLSIGRETLRSFMRWPRVPVAPQLGPWVVFSVQ